MIKRLICAFIILTGSYMSLFPDEKPWHVYFTTPDVKGSIGTVDNPEHALVTAIDGCSGSIDGAFYDITSPRIVDAFLRAKKRGLNIRLVTDDSNYGRAGINSLMRAGIPVVTDTGKGLMHNKFAVLDGRALWTGSYNTTENCAEKNNNNALCFNSREMAGIYEAEFCEMFENGIFGNKKERGGPFAAMRAKYYVKLGDADINVYFSPEDNVERIIVKRLEKAKKSIHFMAFSFTSDGIGDIMIKKHRAGVKVLGVIEKRGSDTKHCEYRRFVSEGVPVHLDRNRYVMHHKVIIIDEEMVITGSYNFTKGASTKNDENIVIVDSAELAKQYLDEFAKLY